MADTRVRASVAIGASLLAVAAAAWVTPGISDRTVRTSDFDVELRALDRDVASPAAPGDVLTNPARAVRVAHRLYQRASLTERSSDFIAVQAMLDGLEDRLGPHPDVSLLQAALHLRFHRLSAARAALARSPDLAGTFEAEMINADIDLQLGRYDRAQRGYERVVERRPAWASLARLAFLTARRGDAALADRLYARAADDVTAKEMRTYAWLELQRGQLDFTRGRYDDAQAHYQLAERAYSGYWLVDEYVAELLAARGRFDDALARYQRAAARAPRPDLFHQIGDLYQFIGRVEDAKGWHQRALDGYLSSVNRGEVQFLHHLAAFYADVARDGRSAVKWARQDAELRPSYATDGALAWALYVDGAIPEAVTIADRALATGIVDGHLYDHAATIKGAAGQQASAARLRATLGELNPRYRDFHVHR